MMINYLSRQVDTISNSHFYPVVDNTSLFDQVVHQPRVPWVWLDCPEGVKIPIEHILTSRIL